MKGVGLGVLTAVYAALVLAAPVSAAETEPSLWRFIGHGDESAAACDLQAQGSVLDEFGADVQLTCATDQLLMGNLQLVLPARALQQRRVLLQLEIKNDAQMLAGVWLKTMHDAQTLMFEDDTEQLLFGTEQNDGGWQLRQLSLPVDIHATQVRIGLLLQGRGDVAVRNVRVLVSQPGAMSSAAVSYLDAAIALLKSQLPERPDMHWSVLEPQMRVLASGAQSTEEVYPAIRYALAQLGGRGDLLLTPAIARAVQGNSSTDAFTAGRWELSDGARLVLTAPEPVRTVAARRIEVDGAVN